MALRNIVKFGDERLRKKCREVTAFDDKLWVLLDDMYETMQASDGVGLAAPQVTYCMQELKAAGAKVKVTAFNRYGKEFKVEGTELLARALCHEIDHLNGIIFTDLADEMVEPEDLEEKRKK